MKKRHAFTLLEIILSLPLVFLLFSFLIMMLTASTKHQYKLEALEKNVLEKHYFQKGLQKKLSRVTKQKEIPVDQLKPNEVIFEFDHGISKQKDLSGSLFGKLHLDENKLVLSLYKKEHKTLKVIRNDTLLTDVKTVHFDYSFEKKRLETKSSPCPYKLAPQAVDSSSVWVALECRIVFKNELSQEFFFTLPRGGS